ncbi:hypothetical protein [Marinibactrum halimedae]|uniref:Uncharacterized protein n=1 Tax=Marinibactrum halimedae TaxID=1444977 RepID=A0AA37WNW7_9GAMM|nr:hypothetical protein [Marinibactrum halimedae]MCD9458548.1 hypothetical protein [Marinibactrum halimedae]GLS26586.1 hypothetical protein GCM10007877_23020 [Marinibactrum halimedae]
MKRISLSIPYSVDLTKEKSWKILDESQTSFGIVRCHFQLNERFLDEHHQVGDALAVYKSPQGVGSQHVIASSFELEKIKQISSIEKFLTENEHTASFATELAAKIELSKENKLSSKIKTQLASKLKSKLSITSELHENQKIREKTSFEITNTIDPEITEPIVAVPAYKRKAYDLLLGHVDFLRVDYKRSLFGLRKKAIKHPPIIDFNNHPNREGFGVPLATIMYWEFLPKSSILMLESEHCVQVKDSEQVTLIQPHCEKTKNVDFPDVPSLYQIANAAFPKKWILRKSENNSWTEEELKNIELEEVKSAENGWWSRHRNSK